MLSKHLKTTWILLALLTLAVLLMIKFTLGRATSTASFLPTETLSTATIDAPVVETQEIVAPHPTTASFPSPVAFPGAEGFGQETVGGRGGRVIEVTNLNDEGPGSLRAAIEAEGARTVVFRVAGTIELQTNLTIKNPYITIAGQTAPGGGITLKNKPSNVDGALIIDTHDVIIRYIRSRPGPPQEPSDNGDALEINGPGARNVIIDHCSFSWAIDEVVSTWYDARNITIQWSIISEGLNCSTHVKGCHSMGLILGSQGSGGISIHHNLFAHNGQRNPLIQTSGIVDVVNNVMFDASYTPITVNDQYGQVSLNIVANFYKQAANDDNQYLLSASSENGPGMKIFVQGNISPTRPDDNMDEQACVKPKGLEWLVPTRAEAPTITETSAAAAYEQVLSEAGASMGLDGAGTPYLRRDAVDERIIQDVINGSDGLIDDPSDVGGWPELAMGEAVKDSDHDGMPDAWEALYGFNPNDPSDGPLDADGDGYSNLEEYLNATSPLSQESR